MQLANYLKQFKNIAWYPSAHKDSLSMISLSYKSLRRFGFSKDEVPDCFIFTDYATYAQYDNNHQFILDLPDYEVEAVFNYDNSEHSATAFNIKELDRLKLSFNQDLVAFESDNYYGHVYIADVLIEHPELGKAVTKLVYVVAENTAFAFEFLLKKGINIKYIIHSRYGNGFGGGLSNGAFMFNIAKDLGVKYIASDIIDHYGIDEADNYLTGFQKSTLPVIRKICNFGVEYQWRGYEDTILYEVTSYKEIKQDENNFKRVIIHGEEGE